ncbi:MAG: DNA gyrase subunit A [Armatimonadota bacterium]|nr:MAG: DNA gyrase subunit A [Armatimonadota bacterium]
MPEALAQPDLIPIEDEMRDSFMQWAVSVIVSRALPDVRDGLKPSQRRILYAMHELNLGPSSAYRKCAKVCGDTQGNYHPHGQEVIYPTLARMAQDWNLRYPVVDGLGNFGSVDGDPPGAMRYTECRLSRYGVDMLADIDQRTVDFMPNFDQSRQEPLVLPSRFPNLLCNGSAGIAVGMATNIPPHNLGEVVDACVLLIDNESATLDEVMQVLPGPDFPTAGLILGMRGIREAYESGRGSIMMQARATIEPLERGRNAIIVTELPYGVNKAQLVQQIADQVRTKRLNGVAALRDESDRKGMRIVVELKPDANPNVVLNHLYKHTRMRSVFPVNTVALVGQTPRTLGIVGLLQQFLGHRREVVTRRAQYQLERAEERAHILEGYLVALKHIDEVIELIKKSPDPPTARSRLMERFGLTEVQAQAILQLVLQRLTNLERSKIQEEYREVIKRINYLRDLLESPRKIMRVVKDELLELKEKLGDERRTRIHPDEAEDISIEDLIAEEDVVITVTRDGYIKRLPVDTYRTQGRGGKGVVGLTAKEEDTVEHLFIASTHQYVLFFTNRGKVYRVRAHEIPAASRQARGTAIINLIPIEPGDVVTATRSVKDFAADRYLFMGTRQGMIKKTSLKEYDTRLKGGIIAINLHQGDSLEWVKVTDGEQDMIIATRQGMAIRFPEKQARPMGRAAAGVRGIRLRPRDEVVGMEVCRKDYDLLVATGNGYGKRTLLDEYRKQARGGVGIKTLQVTRKNGPLVDMKVVEPDDEVLLITAEGHIIRQPVGTIRRTGRSAQGVRLIRLDSGDRVAGLARVVKKEDEDARATDSAFESIEEAASATESDAGRAPERTEARPAPAARARGKAATRKTPAPKKPAAAKSKKPAARKPTPKKATARTKAAPKRTAKPAGKKAAKPAGRAGKARSSRKRR